MIGEAHYLHLRARLADAGYASEYEWSQTVGPPTDADAFFREYTFVVCNSGMKATIARAIFDRIMLGLELGVSVVDVFGHPGKAKAIQDVYDTRWQWFAAYERAPDKLAFLHAMPWIGEITKWHLAKNFGVDCAKPDRHLVRIAGDEGVGELCARLAAATGDRVATVDLILWRAASLGWL